MVNLQKVTNRKWQRNDNGYKIKTGIEIFNARFMITLLTIFSLRLS